MLLEIRPRFHLARVRDKELNDRSAFGCIFKREESFARHPAILYGFVVAWASGLLADDDSNAVVAHVQGLRRTLHAIAQDGHDFVFQYLARLFKREFIPCYHVFHYAAEIYFCHCMLGKCVSNSTFASGRYQFDIFSQDATSVLRFWLFPFFPSLRELFFGNFNVQRFLFRVYRDDVAISDEPDGAADVRFRRDVADDEPVRAAGEAAIGNKRNRIAEPSSDDGRSDGEHFAHPRAAFRNLISDNYRVAGDDRARLYRRERRLLVLKHLRRAAMLQFLDAFYFRDTAAGREVAMHDDDRPAFHHGIHDVMN